MDSKSGRSWVFGLGRGPAGHDRAFAVGTNAKRWRAGHSGVYSLATGQAKWKFRLICFRLKNSPSESREVAYVEK
jgi:hypothetical protein